MTDHDSAFEVAYGSDVPGSEDRTLVAVFASPVARFLLAYGKDLGYRPLLVDPLGEPTGAEDFVVPVRPTMPALDNGTDVVVTDHHRSELGTMLRDALAGNPRWVGVMGNPRHPGPHIQALRELGVHAADIDRVHRPVGLNIGSRAPAEIAIAALAGLIADRNQRPGGFEFPSTPAGTTPA